jgi:hypothetical protein
MYTHVSKCKNDKIKGEKTKTNKPKPWGEKAESTYNLM